MTHAWSLILFTFLGQCAAGLSLFVALDRGEGNDPAWSARAVAQTWAAIGILCVGTLISLTHLASPTVSFYAITGADSSWLSREIMFSGLFGACMLCGVLFKIGLLRWLSPIAGLALVFVMSRVYMVPNQPAWNTWVTPATFYTTAVLLGAGLKLLLDCIAARRRTVPTEMPMFGRLPLVILLAAAARIALIAAAPWQSQPLIEAAHAALLMLAAGLGMVLLTRQTARMWNRSGTAVAPPAGISFVVALLAAAELCGRTAFFNSYTWFGM